MNRLGSAMLAAVLAAALAPLSAMAAKPIARFNQRTGEVTLTNGRLELRIETRQGLNPRQLRDLKSGRLLADADYIWPGGRPPRMLGAPKVEDRLDGSSSVELKGQLGEIVVEQSFTAPPNNPGSSSSA